MDSRWERAIEAFEQTTGLGVTVHDHHGGLWHHVPARRFPHSHAACMTVKTGSEGHRCLRFELEQFPAETFRWPEGRVHRCHAGLVELALRVADGDRPLLTLFAGPARVRSTASLDVAVLHSPAAREVREARRNLPEIDADARRYLELLRQLGARLMALHRSDPTRADSDGTQTATRATVIERFVRECASQPLGVDILADRLGVSPERARHIVVEETGRTLRTLLLNARMNAAAALLTGSGLPVAEVGRHTGYSDAAAFSRAFRSVHGVTPRRWRDTHSA
ncbi:MAG: helix-turn-helix domain-containing protein [Spirochaetota bacterium]